MNQAVSERFWQAEARTEETKRLIQDIKCTPRRKFTAEEKIRIVLEGFRRDTPIRDLCRREGIQPSTYYARLKDFMEAGKDRLQLEATGCRAIPPGRCSKNEKAFHVANPCLCSYCFTS